MCYAAYERYAVGMGKTTTIRLNDEEMSMLDEVAAECGGRSGALKQGLVLLVQDRRRRRGLERFLAEWVEESGPPNPDGVAAMRERYFSGS